MKSSGYQRDPKSSICRALIPLLTCSVKQERRSTLGDFMNSPASPTELSCQHLSYKVVPFEIAVDRQYSVIYIIFGHDYPNPKRLPHSCATASKPHKAFPSAAISVSPTPAIPSRPAASKIPFPTNHLERAPTDASIAAGR